MRMNLRETPGHHPVRPLYEEAYQSHDILTMRTIGINTMAAALRSAFTHSSKDMKLDTLIEGKKKLDEYTDVAMHEVLTRYQGDLARLTDINRFANTALFLEESILVPLTFSSNTRQAHELRKKVVDGMAASAFDSIESELELIDALGSRSRNEYEESVYAMARGALQENTLTALLNYAQDGSLAVVPSTYYEDIVLSIDARAYYIAQDNTHWTAPISFKTSTFAAEKEKEAHPGHVVLCGESVGNKHGEISRLLVREFSGIESLSLRDKTMLENARLKLLEDFTAQIDSSEVRPVRRLPSRKVIEFVRRAA